MSNKVLLITGATGKQGGALIDVIMSSKQAASDFTVYAVTRNVESPSAKKLVSKHPSIKLITGDLNNCPAIFSSINIPVWGVFSLQVAMGKGATVETEEKQGKDLVDASLVNGVSQFVFTSVDRHGEASSNNPTNVPHFKSKHKVEKYLQEKAKGTTMNWTIFRPVFFMENLSSDFMGKMIATIWRVALGTELKLQIVAIHDIGYFAAQAFIQPEEYKNRGISLAGDELSFDELDQLFKKNTGSGVPTTFSFLAYLVLWGVKEISTMFAFFKEQGYAADIPTLKQANPDLIDMEKWLRVQKK